MRKMNREKLHTGEEQVNFYPQVAEETYEMQTVSGSDKAFAPVDTQGSVKTGD